MSIKTETSYGNISWKGSIGCSLIGITGKEENGPINTGLFCPRFFLFIFCLNSSFYVLFKRCYFWHAFHFPWSICRQNCILADEMGLGKTIQSIAFLQEVYNVGIHGPFLVIAPLSTITNWEREFNTWTEMNTIVYHGSLASRQMIQQYEMYCKDSRVSCMSCECMV